jgi:polyferredoxin
MMKFQIKRLISQLIFLLTANLGATGLKTGFCVPFFYCNACPAAAGACPLRPMELSVYKILKEPGNFSIKLLLYPILILGTVGIFTGRAVCGWACPIGLLQRGTARSARFLKKKFPLFKKIGALRIERYLRYIKYLVLIGLVFFTSVFIGFVFTDICPVGMLTGTFPIMILNPGQYFPDTYFYIALVIFILFLLLIFLIERGWCRYFCPVGAFLAPFNKVSYLHVDVDMKKCKHCNICSDVCPMGIDVPNMHRDPECILCGKCVSKCPYSVVKFRRL